MSTAREELRHVLVTAHVKHDRVFTSAGLADAILASDWLMEHVAAQVEAALKEQREGIAAYLTGLIEDAPSPNYEEDDYDAGYVAGLDIARTYTQEGKS